MTNIEKQISLFKEYDITDYSIEGETITVNQTIFLHLIQEVDKEFLKRCYY